MTAIDDENPVLLLNRLLKLSAKYDLDLAADSYLSGLTGQIAALAAAWAPDDDFRREAAQALRHLRGP